MKYVVYLRVSTQYQDVLSQRKMCMDYLQARGSPCFVEFVDQGVSGSLRHEDREQMDDAMNALKRGDIFLVSNRDRLGRDMLWNLMIEREIQKRGATLECVNMQMEGMDEGSQAMFKGFMDNFAQYELFLTRKRTRAKLQQMKSQGFRVGYIPYGYELGEIVETTVNTSGGLQKKLSHKIRPNSGEQQILAKMLLMDQQGVPLREIAHRLNGENIRNRVGSAWSHVSIHKILKNAPSHRAVYVEFHPPSQCKSLCAV